MLCCGAECSVLITAPRTAAADPFAESVVRSILAQLRWLDHVVEPRALSAKLVDTLPVCTAAVQREVIACVPAIVDDQSHHKVVAVMQALMEQDSSLTTAMLDALSNLSL